jgi:hypothetical protein
MPHHFHAVVYIDHAVATIFEFAESGMTEHRILASDRNGNIHHKAGSMGSGHAHDSKTYLTAVADALQSSREILIVDHVPALAPRIMGVETVNHPTNGEIVALARKFFEAKDLMMPQLNKTT